MGANSLTQYPASADQCPADFPVTDCRSALLYPRHAPLADFATRQGTWDFRATWVHVPGDRKSINRDTIVVYFHGHTNSVKVDENGNCARLRAAWLSSSSILIAAARSCSAM